MRYSFISDEYQVMCTLECAPEEQQGMLDRLNAMGYSAVYDTVPPNYQLQTQGSMVPELQSQQAMGGAQYGAYEGSSMNRLISGSHQGIQLRAQGIAPPNAPVQSIPGTVWTRQTSPDQSLSNEMSRSLSNQSNEISSVASDRSPRNELEWNMVAQAQAFWDERTTLAYYAHSPSSFANSPPSHETEIYPVLPQTYALPSTSGTSCVNMSQVQGFINPQELAFKNEEGYAATFNSGPEKRENHMDTRYPVPAHHDYHYHTDSAMGASIKDATSPEATYLQASDDNESEIDAEGDSDGQEGMGIEDKDEDDDYKPSGSRSRKTNKRTLATSIALKPLTKRAKVTKSSSSKRVNRSFKCKQCAVPDFKSASDLTRHVTSTHCRSFICTFAFAGCQSTFSNKNEWKRHVTSQHAAFHVYICELGACGNALPKNTSGKNGYAGAEFNRKDLFTQHVRRMHTPSAIKNKRTVDADWEKKIKEYQDDALTVNRLQPTVLRCPLAECGSLVFQGEYCWDDRMEHVGRHFEMLAKAGEKDVGDVIDQAADTHLVAWALQERIIEHNSEGDYRLCGARAVNVGGRKKSVVADDDGGGEEDADGEYE